MTNEWNAEIKNPLVIYHGNCADGFSAAWCFYHFGKLTGHKYDFHAGVYGKPPPDVKGRTVFLVDFSYKRDVVRQMLDEAGVIVLLDHHKSALEDLEGLEHVYDNFYPNHSTIENSGAMIAWNYLENHLYVKHLDVQRPLLLGHIEDRDLWKFKLPNTREISAAVFSYEYTFENWDKLMLGNQADLLQLTVAGAAIERKHFKDIKELLNVCKRYMEIAGYYVPCASLPYTFASDACHQMAESHEEGKLFAACYYDTATHRVFSLRSTANGVDVSEVAQQYGGGGHKNASGFSVPRNHPLATC